MAIDPGPGGAPGIGEVIGSSWKDAADLAKTNRTPAIVLIVLATLASLSVLFQQSSMRYTTVMAATDILLAIMPFFAIAAAVRTIHPEFRMDVGKFFGLIGYSILVALICAVGWICFVVPGVWFYGKLLLAPYCYLLQPGSPPLQRSWNMTTHRFWPTLGLIILLAIIIGVISAVVSGVAGGLANALPISVIVTVPVLSIVWIWMLHFSCLSYVRWAWALLTSTPQPAMVTAAAG